MKVSHLALVLQDLIDKGGEDMDVHIMTATGGKDFQTYARYERVEESEFTDPKVIMTGIDLIAK